MISNKPSPIPTPKMPLADLMHYAYKEAEKAKAKVLAIATDIISCKVIRCGYVLDKGISIEKYSGFSNQWTMIVPWNQCHDATNINTYITECMKHVAAASEDVDHNTVISEFYEYVSQTGKYPLGVDRCRVKEDWEGAGREGTVLGLMYDNRWVPVLFDDQDDPGWFKKEGLDFGPSSLTGLE